MARVRALRQPTTVRGYVTGRFLGWTSTGDALVDHPDSLHGPIAARVVDTARRSLRSAGSACDVVLVFDGESSDRPIVIATIGVDSQETQNQIAPDDLVVDGRRVEITGAEEIVLRCGEAYICLRANGRLVVHGTHVESDSDGINRIKGGVVKVN